MKMIDRVIRSMQDTGLIDGMSLEDADTLATAALEGMREPNDNMVECGADGMTYTQDSTLSLITRFAWRDMIDAALNE